MSVDKLMELIRVNGHYDFVKKLYAKKGYQFFIGDMNLNIFGIRCKTSTNEYDDIIGVAYEKGFEKSGYKYLEMYEGTTDPGKFYLNNPINENGTAILVPGQYLRSHKIGVHKNYTALVQDSTLKVYRDRNKDNIHDFNEIYQAPSNCGINIHYGKGDLVDKWSAGCQVILSPNKFIDFMDLCLKSSVRRGKYFTYTLFDIKDVEECLEL
jgi:hypothetical protein